MRNLKIGDSVITTSGLKGIITEPEGQHFWVRFENGQLLLWRRTDLKNIEH